MKKFMSAISFGGIILVEWHDSFVIWHILWRVSGISSNWNQKPRLKSIHEKTGVLCSRAI